MSPKQKLENSNRTSTASSPRRILGRFYYAAGGILLLLGLTIRLLPSALHKEGIVWEALGEVGSFLALIVSLHLVYELLIKQEEHQLFISEMRSELNASLNGFLKKSNKNKFKLVFMKKGDEATGANKRIKRAKFAIRVTHFTDSNPNQEYVDLMCKKLDKGIPIYRIVASEKYIRTENIDISWLQPFKTRGSYTEYQLKEGIIPIDFCVFDNDSVILYLPRDNHSQSLSKAIIIDNQDVASIFKDLFEHLIPLSTMTFEGKQLRSKEQEKQSIDNEQSA